MLGIGVASEADSLRATDFKYSLYQASNPTSNENEHAHLEQRQSTNEAEEGKTADSKQLQMSLETHQVCS